MPYREARGPAPEPTPEADVRSARRARRIGRVVVTAVGVAIVVASALAVRAKMETNRELREAVQDTEACLLGPEPLEERETPKMRFRRRQLTAMQDRATKAGPTAWPMRCAAPAGRVHDRAAAVNTREHHHLAESASDLERELRVPTAFEADLANAIDGFYWSPLTYTFSRTRQGDRSAGRESSPGEMPRLAHPMAITALGPKTCITTVPNSFTLLVARPVYADDGAITFGEDVVVDTRFASGGPDRTCTVTAEDRTVRCAAWVPDAGALVVTPRSGDPSFLQPAPAPIVGCRSAEVAFSVQSGPPAFVTFDPRRRDGWQPAPIAGNVACGPGAVGWLLDPNPEVLSVARCTTSGCDLVTFDPLRDLGAGSKALAPPAAPHYRAEGILDGKLVVAWFGARGGLRLRIGEVASFASARDVVVVEDRVDPSFGPGPGDGLSFVQLFARRRFAVLAVGKHDGIHLLRVDPEGAIIPLEVVQSPPR